MKHARWIGSALFALALSAQPLLAADLPVRAPVTKAPVFAPVFDWTGWYVGVQGGYGWGNATSFEIDDAGNVNAGPLDYQAKGWLAGGHVGYQRQFGSFVLGIVSDLEFADINGDFFFAPGGNNLRKEIRWLGSLRGKIGVAFDRVHLYGTGGLAYGGVKMTANQPSLSASISGTETAVGWTAGGGAEFAFTNAISGWVEYRYTDLGDTDHTGFIYGGTFTYPHDNKFHAVRGGVSFRFGAPMVARY